MNRILKTVALFIVVCSALVTVHGALGLMTMKNILTGRIYDEMDGLIPYFELIVAGPVFLVLLVILIKASGSGASSSDT